jgi:hypothetical protein
MSDGIRRSGRRREKGKFIPGSVPLEEDEDPDFDSSAVAMDDEDSNGGNNELPELG